LEPTSSTDVPTSAQIRELQAALPDLLVLMGLLSRLLAKLEEPPGEIDKTLAETMAQLSALAREMTKAAESLASLAGPEGTFARIETEIAASRQEQLDQRHQIATLTQQVATLLDWLSAPLAPESGTSLPT
jgi:chromosome segregation ATPase